MMKNQNVVIYSDGACPGNQKSNPQGGYGAIVMHEGSTLELAQGYRQTSNNRMELRAVIAAFKTIQCPSMVTVYSDSKYVTDAFNQQWIENWLWNGWRNSKGKPVLNQDLWKELLEETISHKVTWKWVKGHSTDTLNNRADQLAVLAANSKSNLGDIGPTTVTIVNKY